MAGLAGSGEAEARPAAPQVAAGGVLSRPLGAVSKRKEDHGSSCISALTAGDAVVFVWERCRPAVVVCAWAHVSVCLQDTSHAEVRGEYMVLCDIKAWTNKVLVAGV